MALIEGVGDEVTLLFGLMLLLMVLLLAWISTRTSEPPQHLFTSSTGPAPSHLVTPSQRTTEDASSSSSSSPSSLSSSETSSVTGTLPTSDPDQDRVQDQDQVQDQVQDQDQDQDRVQAGGRDGDGVRNRGESLSSQRNMVVRLKFLNDTERTAQVKPQDTIGYIKRTYFAGQEDQVRFIYQGQLLQDDARTLASLNLVHNCVLHCHISQHAAGRRGAAGGPGPGDQVQVALNVGSLMVPLLVLMLAVLWYCQIQYRHFFTAPATASLVGVTVLLSMAAFGVYRR